MNLLHYSITSLRAAWGDWQAVVANGISRVCNLYSF